uniref:Uncharacterized protein n=1 Tax=Chromera velia CCMP2878 TaxID=1169474 RepID=A0A0G4GYX7_9ALVE|eukprot:Cvel_23980.t1-p1 / transcript=Cvel_23980.t1 / gene=Cvel_23980 / organism=Chromera_velia_CCMP2878 / gene_product=hypothetical protein / transcript_product=hypothetical protein / location=Cvel_scaffold2539:3579-26424(-) / protein_length=2693 / sequence_SO=supercontig / SO=protein_coding / is_pseudo=false
MTGVIRMMRKPHVRRSATLPRECSLLSPPRQLPRRELRHHRIINQLAPPRATPIAEGAHGDGRLPLCQAFLSRDRLRQMVIECADSLPKTKALQEPEVRKALADCVVAFCTEAKNTDALKDTQKARRRTSVLAHEAAPAGAAANTLTIPGLESPPPPPLVGGLSLPSPGPPSSLGAVGGLVEETSFWRPTIPSEGVPKGHVSTAAVAAVCAMSRDVLIGVMEREALCFHSQAYLNFGKAILCEAGVAWPALPLTRCCRLFSDCQPPPFATTTTPAGGPGPLSPPPLLSGSSSFPWAQQNSVTPSARDSSPRAGGSKNASRMSTAASGPLQQSAAGGAVLKALHGETPSMNPAAQMATPKSQNRKRRPKTEPGPGGAATGSLFVNPYELLIRICPSRLLIPLNAVTGFLRQKCKSVRTLDSIKSPFDMVQLGMVAEDSARCFPVLEAFREGAACTACGSRLSRMATIIQDSIFGPERMKAAEQASRVSLMSVANNKPKPAKENLGEKAPQVECQNPTELLINYSAFLDAYRSWELSVFGGMMAALRQQPHARTEWGDNEKQGTETADIRDKAEPGYVSLSEMRSMVSALLLRPEAQEVRSQESELNKAVQHLTERIFHMLPFNGVERFRDKMAPSAFDGPLGERQTPWRPLHAQPLGLHTRSSDVMECVQSLLLVPGLPSLDTLALKSKAANLQIQATATAFAPAVSGSINEQFRSYMNYAARHGHRAYEQLIAISSRLFSRQGPAGQAGPMQGQGDRPPPGSLPPKSHSILLPKGISNLESLSLRQSVAQGGGEPSVASLAGGNSGVLGVSGHDGSVFGSVGGPGSSAPVGGYKGRRLGIEDPAPLFAHFLDRWCGCTVALDTQGGDLSLSEDGIMKTLDLYGHNTHDTMGSGWNSKAASILEEQTCTWWSTLLGCSCHHGSTVYAKQAPETPAPKSSSQGRRRSSLAFGGASRDRKRGSIMSNQSPHLTPLGPHGSIEDPSGDGGLLPLPRVASTPQLTPLIPRGPSVSGLPHAMSLMGRRQSQSISLQPEDTSLFPFGANGPFFEASRYDDEARRTPLEDFVFCIQMSEHAVLGKIAHRLREQPMIIEDLLSLARDPTTCASTTKSAATKSTHQKLFKIRTGKTFKSALRMITMVNAASGAKKGEGPPATAQTEENGNGGQPTVIGGALKRRGPMPEPDIATFERFLPRTRWFRHSNRATFSFWWRNDPADGLRGLLTPAFIVSGLRTSESVLAAASGGGGKAGARLRRRPKTAKGPQGASGAQTGSAHAGTDGGHGEDAGGMEGEGGMGGGDTDQIGQATFEDPTVPLERVNEFLEGLELGLPEQSLRVFLFSLRSDETGKVCHLLIERSLCLYEKPKSPLFTSPSCTADFRTHSPGLFSPLCFAFASSGTEFGLCFATLQIRLNDLITRLASWDASFVGAAVAAILALNMTPRDLLSLVTPQNGPADFCGIPGPLWVTRGFFIALLSTLLACARQVASTRGDTTLKSKGEKEKEKQGAPSVSSASPTPASALNLGGQGPPGKATRFKGVSAGGPNDTFKTILSSFHSQSIPENKNGFLVAAGLWYAFAADPRGGPEIRGCGNGPEAQGVDPFAFGRLDLRLFVRVLEWYLAHNRDKLAIRLLLNKNNYASLFDEPRPSLQAATRPKTSRVGVGQGDEPHLPRPSTTATASAGAGAVPSVDSSGNVDPLVLPLQRSIHTQLGLQLPDSHVQLLAIRMTPEGLPLYGTVEPCLKVAADFLANSRILSILSRALRTCRPVHLANVDVSEEALRERERARLASASGQQQTSEGETQDGGENGNGTSDLASRVSKFSKMGKTELTNENTGRFLSLVSTSVSAMAVNQEMVIEWLLSVLDADSVANEESLTRFLRQFYVTQDRKNIHIDRLVDHLHRWESLVYGVLLRLLYSGPPDSRAFQVLSFQNDDKEAGRSSLTENEYLRTLEALGIPPGLSVHLLAFCSHVKNVSALSSMSSLREDQQGQAGQGGGSSGGVADLTAEQSSFWISTHRWTSCFGVEFRMDFDAPLLFKKLTEGLENMSWKSVTPDGYIQMSKLRTLLEVCFTGARREDTKKGRRPTTDSEVDLARWLVRIYLAFRKGGGGGEGYGEGSHLVADTVGLLNGYKFFRCADADLWEDRPQEETWVDLCLFIETLCGYLDRMAVLLGLEPSLREELLGVCRRPEASCSDLVNLIERIASRDPSFLSLEGPGSLAPLSRLHALLLIAFCRRPSRTEAQRRGRVAARDPADWEDLRRGMMMKLQNQATAINAGTSPAPSVSYAGSPHDKGRRSTGESEGGDIDDVLASFQPSPSYRAESREPPVSHRIQPADLSAAAAGHSVYRYVRKWQLLCLHPVAMAFASRGGLDPCQAAAAFVKGRVEGCGGRRGSCLVEQLWDLTSILGTSLSARLLRVARGISIPFYSKEQAELAFCFCPEPPEPETPKEQQEEQANANQKRSSTVLETPFFLPQASSAPNISPTLPTRAQADQLKGILKSNGGRGGAGQGDPTKSLGRSYTATMAEGATKGLLDDLEDPRTPLGSTARTPYKGPRFGNWNHTQVPTRLETVFYSHHKSRLVSWPVSVQLIGECYAVFLQDTLLRAGAELVKKRKAEEEGGAGKLPPIVRVLSEWTDHDTPSSGHAELKEQQENGEGGIFGKTGAWKTLGEAAGIGTDIQWTYDVILALQVSEGVDQSAVE